MNSLLIIAFDTASTDLLPLLALLPTAHLLVNAKQPTFVHQIITPMDAELKPIFSEYSIVLNLTKRINLAWINACLALNITYLDTQPSDYAITLLPVLSSAVIKALSLRFAQVTEIEIGKTQYKLTPQAWLAEVTIPFTYLANRSWHTACGINLVKQHYYGDNVGLRWQCQINSPELWQIPPQYPALTTLRVYQTMSRHGSWLARIPLVKLILNKLTRNAGPQGLYVSLQGTGLDYQPLMVTWTLTSASLAALENQVISFIVTKILENPTSELELLSLAEFDKILTQQTRSYAIIHEL